MSKKQKLVKDMQKTQTQKQLFKYICHHLNGDDTLRFIFRHYNSVYNTSLHAWTHSHNYHPVDLNEAQTMTLSAIQHM